MVISNVALEFKKNVGRKTSPRKNSGRTFVETTQKVEKIPVIQSNVSRNQFKNYAVGLSGLAAWRLGTQNLPFAAKLQ